MRRSTGVWGASARETWELPFHAIPNFSSSRKFSCNVQQCSKRHSKVSNSFGSLVGDLCQVYELWQFTIIGWSMSSRPNTPYRPCLCSHDVSKTDMERQAPDTRHQAPYIGLYQTLVLSVLLYAADTWTLLSADVKTLDAFRQKCLRQLLGMRWYDRVRNDEVLQRTGLTTLSHLLSRRPISVFGHVARPRSSTEQVARPATKRFHASYWRPLEASCRPWTRWCNDATALAGYSNSMMMMICPPVSVVVAPLTGMFITIS